MGFALLSNLFICIFQLHQHDNMCYNVSWICIIILMLYRCFIFFLCSSHFPILAIITTYVFLKFIYVYIDTIMSILISLMVERDVVPW